MTNDLTGTFVRKGCKPISDMTKNEIMDLDLDSLSHDELKKVTEDEFTRFRRWTVLGAWSIGRKLNRIRRNSAHGEWSDYLRKIDMDATMAKRFRRLADGYREKVQIAPFASVDAALKALPPVRSQAEIDTTLTIGGRRRKPPPSPDDKAVDEIAAEQMAKAEAERKEAQDERLAMRLEGSDLEAVEALNSQLDAKTAEAVQHGERANSEVRRRQRAEKKVRDIRDFLLNVRGPNKAVDDCLAQFWNVARKGAAA